MGLLNAVGVNNGLSDFIAAHRGALTQFGANFASGPTIQQGIALGTQGLAQGAQADQAYAESQAVKQKAADQINATVKYLQSNPAFADLVPIAQAGDGAAALSEAFKRSDPANKLDLQYKQAQIDSLNNKPAQPLINAGSGLIYDPNAGKWITPPDAAAGGSAAPTVGFTSDGHVDPAAQDAFLQTLDPQYANIVKGVANYELDPTKITTLRGDQRQKLIEAVKAYDPTYDGSQFGVKVAARKDFTSGQSAQNLKAANTLIGHLDELKKASIALGNGSIPLFNAAGNLIKSNTGNAGPTTYGVASQASADELAKVFKGGGASDVESIKGWQSKLDVNASPEQQGAAIKEAVSLLESRVAALRDQYQQAMGKPADFSFLSTKAAKALQDLGVDPKEIDPNYGSGPNLPDGGAGAPDPELDRALKQYGGN